MKKRILVIDDDPMMIKLMQSRLLGAGYDVQTAANGSEGMKQIKASRPDLILLDIMMPDMDGVELSRTLKENEAFKKIPIIFITSLQTKEEEKTIGKNQSNRIFAKPFDAKALLGEIESLIQK